MGGSADEGGAWEYGRLEVLINGIWSFVKEEFSFEGIGLRGAQVACRSLGFAAGAQLVVGESSPFPASSGSLSLANEITCDGSETSLADCDITILASDRSDATLLQQTAVALICSNPSGVLCPAACRSPSMEHWSALPCDVKANKLTRQLREVCCCISDGVRGRIHYELSLYESRS